MKRISKPLRALAVAAAVGAVYYGLLAAPRYTTTAVVSLRSMEVAPGASGLAGLVALNTAGDRDTRQLAEYIRSADMAEHLERSVGLKAVWSSPALDFVSRFGTFGASREQFVDYYQRRVNIDLDETSGTITVEAQSFDAKHANSIAKEVLSQSERFVNEVANSLANQQLKEAEAASARAQARLMEAESALAAFQGKNRLIDAEGRMKARAELVAKYEADLLATETELKQSQTFLASDSHAVQGLRAKAASLRSQIESQTKAMFPSDNSSVEASVRFRELKQRAGFMEAAYRSAQAFEEATRLEAQRKAKSIVVLARPTEAETPTRPRRLIDFGLYCLSLLGLFGSYTLLRTIIREQRT